MRLPGFEALKRNALEWLVVLLWVVTASATLIENDAYRYSGVLLFAYGLYRYLAMAERPAVGLPAWLCVGWGSYALGRFLLQYLLGAGHPEGDGELMYAMPLAFPSLGFAMFIGWQQMQKVIATYFGVALATLLLTTRYRAIMAGETVRPLIQHNQIHGAVCCGVILISACFWFIHCRKCPTVSRQLRTYASIVAPLVAMLCIFCIYGAKSKGVWLALGFSGPLLLLSIVGWFRSKAGLAFIGCFVLLLAAGGYFVWGNLEKTAGPTFMATTGLYQDIAAGEPIGKAVAARIDDATTPRAMDERLQLWSNAWELVASAPLFGLGNAWEPRWHKTHYTSVDYNAMHNGYLEILVRYGAVGSVFLAFMAVVMLLQVQRAAKLDLVPQAAFHGYLLVQIFFAITLLSNSNNRLAIGETIIMLSFTFALACNLRIRASASEAREGIVMERAGN